ncbi:triose-phosphate isomerase [Paenirhodobacter populi]|uniref:Triosephosphate isomerase n=1 Tax=Paenirhodobacter populi TaxID=2306993 RepID=A0A443KAI8_9RHOB|nr:triose-phosphate isomerase [Sinirhodobacter populi]RWR09366.1 triose-phosphate isomerase [Sinirhodobacter populi]RWR20767.1 triose-phosphate isomerase [Sinirhodobacter populi]RWR29770.1 triose-phosphate isomerase [Sinirhodobacter populi]
MRRKLAAGNWKMNGLRANLGEIEALIAAHPAPDCEVLICPPYTLVSAAADLVKGRIAIGGQNCHPQISGAYTGGISARMLKDAGASHVILGHSERRADRFESDELVHAKSTTAISEGLIAIICVGETERERDRGATLDVISSQLKGSLPLNASGASLVIAYEPIWAIGSGRTPTLEQIAEVHDFMRAEMVKKFGDDGEEIRLLYGGSVKPSNAADIFTVSNVDGALVGGASLLASDFGAIVAALEAS